MEQENKGLIDHISELLPPDVLARMMVDRCSDGTDKWKYTEWIASKYFEMSGTRAKVELVINGTKEVDITNWNDKVATLEDGKVDKASWDNLVGKMSLLTPTEREAMINLKAPVIEFITKEINRLGGVSNGSND